MAMTISAKTLLVLAGIASLGVSFLHLGIVYLGVPAYRFFGAGEFMVALAQAGSLVPALATVAVALVLTGFAAYAFSGAGMIRPLPCLRLSLWIIGTIFTLRGLAVLIQAGKWIGGDPEPARELVFSLGSLAIGLLYLAGARGTRVGRVSGMGWRLPD